MSTTPWGSDDGRVEQLNVWGAHLVAQFTLPFF